MPASCLVKMNNIAKKPTNYINAVCKSKEQKLLGAERLNRMAEASSLEEAFAILRENNFFGGEISCSASEFTSLIANEQKRLNQFLLEYAPNDECKIFCLSSLDFYNAEVLVKCEFNKLDHSKFIGLEGLYTLQQLKDELLKGNGNFPKELVGAVNESKNALENGFGGMTVGGIFSKALYAYLLRVIHTDYLKQIIKKEIDLLNLSIALRCEDAQTANSLYISGSLSMECFSALIKRDESAVNSLIAPYLRDLAIKCIRLCKEGKPLIELERKLSSIGADRMIAERYTELSGSNPFILYYYRRKNEIICARMVLTGKQNGLDPEQIKRRMVSV